MRAYPTTRDASLRRHLRVTLPRHIGGGPAMSRDPPPGSTWLRERLVGAAPLLGDFELDLMPTQVADHLGSLVLGIDRKLGEAGLDEID